DRRWGDLVFGNGANFLEIVFAVEKMSIDPPAAVREQLTIGLSVVVFAENECHLFGSSERAKVVNAAKRIRSVKFDVIGVVLDSLEHAIAVGIPTARNPGE